ncbi:ankyrin repeat domain-containing protein [Wolbachia endosymbiont of Dactylopius coccus]
MVNTNKQQERPQDFELMELLFDKVDSSTSDVVDLLDKSFEARFQSLVNQIQSYLHSSEKPGFFPHRFLGSFSSVLDTKLNDKLGIKKLHFRFDGARTLKVVAETESKIRVFIFTEDIEAQNSKPMAFEFTKGEFKDVIGRDYNALDADKLQIDVIKILKDKYELVKGRPKSDKDVESKKLYLYLKSDGVLEYKARDIYGDVRTIKISHDQLKGEVFDKIKQFLGKQGKDLSDDVRKELSRMTSEKGHTLKSDRENEKISIKVESKKKIKDIPISPLTRFPFEEVKKKLGKDVYLDNYIEKLASPDTDQVQNNLKSILNYITKVYAGLSLPDNVYGAKAREADQHGFLAGVFDNFRYRHNAKIYLEQFAGRGYADIVLLVRGPNRAIDSVPILIELKAGTEGQVDPSDALKQAEGYVKGFRPNKMRVLTNAGNVIAVGLNLDNAEPFKTEVKPIKQPPAPLMEEFIELVGKWDNKSAYEEVFKREVKDLLSSEYHTFPANKETKDHYYFSRDILGQSILINKIGQDQSNIKKYIYSYGEYPLNWPQGTEYTLSKSPVMTLIFIQGNEGQEKTAFIFHIRESNTKKFYADKKIPVLNIPEIGRVKNVIEIKMSLKKHETGLSFEELFEIEQISKYNPSGTDQQFTGSFFKIPNSDELKVKFDQAITSQHATSSDGEGSLQAYKALLTEVADKIYPIKDLITNEARLQAVLNGLFSSYSDLKLQETSAKTVIISEFQVGAGGRVDVVIQAIGPSPQGTKEFTPMALEFKLINKNLNQDQQKQEVDKLTKEQNIRYAKGAALKTITDSDKMFFMGVVVNVKAQDKNSLILTSDKLISAKVRHSSVDVHLKDIKQLIQRLKSTTIKETLESATIEKNYHYWLQQHDIADIARVEYGYGTDTLFEVVGSPEHIASQLQQFQNSVIAGDERRPLTLIVNLDNNHWVTLVISYQNGQYNGYYVDSLGNNIPDNIRQVLQRAQITVNDVSVAQQTDGHNCGLWALENARDINTVLQGSRNNVLDEIRSHLQVRERSEDYFVSLREHISNILSMDSQRIANLEAVLAETQQTKFNLNSCVKPGGRSKISINPCLFSKSDVEKFSREKVDENNADKIVIDSEKFLTYVKNSQDEGKNAQLIEFIGTKNIEGDYKYLVDKVIKDQGYERYIQNERIKDFYGDILQQDSGFEKNSKLKGRLMNAAGTIQLIRGIHGAIVSCKDGTAIDCGLSLGGIGWSFASQPIENIMVKVTPKVVTLAERVVGKVIPGMLGKQTKFAIRIAGVKYGSTVAKGVAGTVAGVLDIIDIGRSVNSLIDCKNRENGNNPCEEKEIRDNIASISFAGVSFVSGIALAATSMPVAGIAVGFGIMVGQGVYSGISNIIEYEKKYDTTSGENWSIFWRTVLFQSMASDVKHLKARKDVVNNLAKKAWEVLSNSSSNVVAYGLGLGKIIIEEYSYGIKPCPATRSKNILSQIVGCVEEERKKQEMDGVPTFHAGYAKILMNIENTNTESLSRVIPDRIAGASSICLPQITNEDYEKGIKNSVPSAVYYCENAMVIGHNSRINMKQKDKTIVYDLQNVNDGDIVGSNKWNNNFLIYSGAEKITGGNNVVNRFVLLSDSRFLGKVIGGNNSTNVLDLSQVKKDVVKTLIDYRFKPNDSGLLKVKVNNKWLINDQIGSNGVFNYQYIGRRNKEDEVLCTGHFDHFTETDNREVIIDSGGGFNSEKEDIVENCRKVIVSPYTTVKGRKSDYTFYVENADYKGCDLYSEIDVDGTGTVVFPEFDLLSDCDQITYCKDSNTLSLKINFGQNNQFTLDIKNYVEQSSNKPHFVLIDKNGSNIVPKFEKSDSPIVTIDLFELHTVCSQECSLDNLNSAEDHYKKVLNNKKGYKVLSLIRGEIQNKDYTNPHMVFGSSGDDVINFDQGTMLAKGESGSDVYIIDSGVGKREVIIDNNSGDKKLDTILMQEIPEEFEVRKCDLHLNYNGTDIQVKNYFQDDSYRHLMVMNSRGETFIPYVQSISCVGSSMREGKLVPFFHATQTHNMFRVPKDFQGDYIVIDSRNEDIEQYKDKDDLLLIRKKEIPFTVNIEGFYNDQSRRNNINFFLWNNGNFSYLDLPQEIDEIVNYQDKLKDDYEKIVKEYVIDFSNSTSVEHNQKLERNISTFVGQDEERIGVMVLKNITPNQVEVFVSGTDLVFRDKGSNHTINIRNWDSSKSHRISTLEFDLGLEPITIRKLGRFSLSEVRKIQDLIDKASESYQNRSEYTPKVENDLKCLISVTGFKKENKKPAYQCLGFSSLRDQINFTENLCDLEQLIEFKDKLNSTEILALSRKLQNNLLLNGYGQNVLDQCSESVLAQKSGQQVIEKISSMVKNIGSPSDLPPAITVNLEKFSNISDNSDLTEHSHRKKRHVLESGKESVIVKKSNSQIECKNNTTNIITSGYEELDVDNLPLQEVIIHDDVNRKKSLKSRLDLCQLVKQIDRDLNVKLMPVIIKDKSDLVIKLSISTVVLQQDIIAVRLKNALVNNWYKKLEIIFNNAPMRIDDNLNLKPSLLISDQKNVIVRSQDVEKMSKLILSQKAGQYKFFHAGYDLILTYGFDTESYIYLKDFYKETVMETLSIRFTDREMLLHDEIEKIYNADSMIISYKSSDPSKVKQISDNVNINVQDEFGKTPIFYAIQRGNRAEVELLLNRKAEIEIQDKLGRTPILYAAQEGKWSIVELLIDRGANIDNETTYQETPLHFAVQEGNLDIIEFLLNRGADIESQDYSNRTPLHRAVEADRLDVVKLLLNRGANIEAQDMEGQTPLDLAVQRGRTNIAEALKQARLNKELLTAVREGDLSKVRESINQGASMKAKNKFGRPPLVISAQKCHLDVMKFLLDKNADIEAKDDDGATSLHWAASIGFLDMVKYLIEKGANINSKMTYLGTALHLVVQEGNLYIVKFLLDRGADIESQDYSNRTPLHCAVEAVRLDIVELLIDRGANINAENIYGKKPIHCAAEKNHENVLKFLLSKGANIDDTDKNGWTPLHCASGNNHLDIVKFLIGKGADVNAKDNDDKTPLDLAIGGNYIGIMEFLKQAQLDKRLLAAAEDGDLGKVKGLIDQNADVNTRDKSGWTPLHFAAYCDRFSVVKFLLNNSSANIKAKDVYGNTPLHIAAQYSSKIEIVEFLLDNSASDINDTTNNGWTPLRLAIQGDKPNTVKFLLNKGASIETKDRYGQTSLDLAVERGYTDMVKLLRSVQLGRGLSSAVRDVSLGRIKVLIELGADLEAKDKDGNTPLMNASLIGNLDVVGYLVSKGADIYAKANDGKTALDIARGAGHTDIVQYFEERGRDYTNGKKAMHFAAENNDVETLSSLVNKGKNVNDCGDDYWRPLHYAARAGSLEATQFLVEKGAGFYANKYKTTGGQAPIHIAAYYGNKNIVKFFVVEKGVDVNWQDGYTSGLHSYGNYSTPLHWASKGDHLDVVEYLVSLGANINAQDWYRKTPLDIARNKGNNDIVEYLKGELKEERPLQRRRRHAMYLSNQPEVTASSGIRPSLWMSSCISWVKKLTASTFSIIPGLPAQYNIADKNDDINARSDNKNIPQSTASVGWNNFLNNENIALASCVVDTLDDTSSKRYQNLISKGVEVVPNNKIAVEFALRKFDSFVEGKIRNLGSKEQARIRVELKDAYPEITASLERGVEFSGNVGLDNVLEKCKKCFCTNVLPKDKVLTCLSDVGVTKLGNNLSK